MSVETVARDAQAYMAARGVAGWLLYDYRGMNPTFWETVGSIPNVTRPCWLWIPAAGTPRLLVSYVDQGRFTHLGIDTGLFDGREQMAAGLRDLLTDSPLVAMEYSPNGTLPRVSRVDAGTIELVRSLGVEVVSSGDVLQYATQRWSDGQLRSHEAAAGALTAIVGEAFAFIGNGLAAGTTEHAVAEFIRGRFAEKGLEATDGPVVAANEHSSDPHFDPTPETSRAIEAGDWVLIDLWARLAQEDAVFADITWTAYVCQGRCESVPAGRSKTVPVDAAA
jgi:Xaa-Pro aminopeptidase